MNYLLLALAWTAFCALHSAMISETATRALQRRLGASFRFYRLIYNAVAVLTLIPVLLYSRSLHGVPFFRWDGAWRVPHYVLVASGLLLFFAGARQYSLRQFLGISHVRGASTAGLASGGGIDSRGVLGVVRHPWYTAVVLLLWSGDLDTARVVGNGVLTAYIVVGTLLEERKLVHEFGDEYRRYQRQVSMFLPLKWLGARLAR